MKLEVLHVPDCPNLPPLLDRLAEVTDLQVSTRVIESDAEAGEFGMAGSPTLLIDGRDPFAATDDYARGISCRLYRDEDGRIVSGPSVHQLRAAIAAAGQSSAPAEVLSTWRIRALPLDPVERSVQQAILRTFASTGQPPAMSDLDVNTVGGSRSTLEVLTALHDLDAIRLNPAGQIAVAYPFSAVPTRHRVRIGDQRSTGIDVYAMCAIDALGISAMVGRNTLIDSVDVTTGQTIAVTTTDGRTSWEPAGAVVFVGADTGGGASADCCCDYLNFFSDRAAANAWISAHPHIPGQILNQTEAEDLAIRLFGHLLRAD